MKRVTWLCELCAFAGTDFLGALKTVSRKAAKPQSSQRRTRSYPIFVKVLEMAKTYLSYQSFVIRLVLALSFACVFAVSIRAQTAEDLIAKLPPNLAPDDLAIQKILTRGYVAYSKKDVATLLSLFSQKSPYFPDFKVFIEEDFAVNENAKIDGLQALLVRNVQFQGDRATARLKVQIHAVDRDTGKEAEGFGPMDHTIRFVREDGVWKMWQFVDTAEELTSELLAAKTEEERAEVLKTSEPFTDGLLRELADQAQSLLEKKGDYTQAAMIFNNVLSMSRRVNSLLGTANALVGLGDVYLAQGDYLSAADNYQQVMKLAEKLDRKEGVAAVSVKLGNVHYYQGNLAQAMEYYQRSASLYEKLGSTQNIAYPLLSIGNAYFAQQNYLQALDYYQRSLKIYERILDKGGTAYLLNRIAEVHAVQGRYPQAVEFYERSLKLQEERGLKAMTALSLNGIANVRYREGKHEEAAELSARAAELAREGNSPEALWSALTTSGQAYRALKDVNRAELAFMGAIAVLEKLRGQLVGDERERQLFFENKTVPYVAMVELLVAQNKVAEAFHYAELAKGRMLLDVLRNGRADITQTMTDEERAQEKQLNVTLNVLGAQMRKESSLPQPDKARLASLETQTQTARLAYEGYETRIYAAHPELKVKRGAVDPIAVDDVAPLIRASESALLEYVVAPEKTYLFVLTKRDRKADAIDIKVYPIAIGAEELVARVQEFRRQLAGNSLDFKNHSRQLYDLLVKPAQEQLEGKERVCIVPAGGLWELPFQALLSASDKYFLEDHAVAYSPSLSVLLEMKKKDARRELAYALPAVSAGAAALVRVSDIGTGSAPLLLALGNPALKSSFVSRAKSSDRSLSFGELPDAEREVKTLGQIYGARNSRILTGAAAREETFKADASRYPVLHFATHGLLDDSNPLYSRLLLASSSADDDGLLEAREIMKLNLNADLAVLSACQTARGTIGPGEGLIGMSWAFFIAGASTTVVSQWKVDSASTASLMVDFHRYLQSADKQRPVTKAEALRQAALRLMADPKYRHPFFWSGFVVVGNGM
jgi:CHAT domain-containing protein/TolA-binding protein